MWAPPPAGAWASQRAAVASASLTAEGPKGPALSLERPPPCDCWELAAASELVADVLCTSPFFFSRSEMLKRTLEPLLCPY